MPEPPRYYPPTIPIEMQKEGKTFLITYAPVIDVRNYLVEAAAAYAGTGNAGDILISVAMFQAVDIIDKTYPTQLTCKEIKNEP